MVIRQIWKCLFQLRSDTVFPFLQLMNDDSFNSHTCENRVINFTFLILVLCKSTQKTQNAINGNVFYKVI